jgi:hypothetical protein
MERNQASTNPTACFMHGANFVTGSFFQNTGDKTRGSTCPAGSESKKAGSN